MKSLPAGSLRFPSLRRSRAVPPSPLPVGRRSRAVPRALVPAAAILMATGSVLAGWGVKTTLEACPEAVRKVVESKVDDGLVDEVRVRTVDGTALYLVEIERPEYRDIELYLRPDGTVQEARHEMKWDDVPEKVREMAVAMTPTNGKIDDAMRRTLHGKDDSDATYVIEYDRVDAPDLHLELAADGTEVGRVDEIED